jgi:hypothetical protein
MNENAAVQLCTSARKQEGRGAVMKKPNPLLAAMKSKEPEAVQEAAALAPAATPAPAPATQKPAAKRAGQKHLGAYFDKRDPILERVALLRARLDMTNSELIEHALNELWKRHEAGRAFGE